MTTPSRRLGYRQARAVTAEHGTTYYLATRLLTPPQRRAVHALYAFARRVDDIVDVDTAVDVDHADVGDRVAATAAIDAIETELFAGLAGTTVTDPGLDALVDTIDTFAIPHHHFRAFLRSMRMDAPSDPLFRNRYHNQDELAEYMYGSAAVIGLQLLPVLGTTTGGSLTEAGRAAASLGVAFQLTNFIRDVGDDLNRDRVYLPLDDLAAFGVDEEMLWACRRTGRSTPELQRALAHQIAVTRAEYRRAETGIALLAPRSRPAIRTAFELYRDILAEVEAADFHIMRTRVRVGTAQRLRRAGRASLGRWSVGSA
ncbi:phytoene/squalene synthase family protein [Williamsia sterculiae]|uniref:Phytoene synthase n=1 Tax=Williamsia sterculiae TaxID=1344003 RepID=A0A1N7H738_9NOCA|nr:phytoene/squalene synthase family protein [Williamsia sterculiae]SIS20685.1 phytoene synthase [Williamsia sterculiae]